MIEAITIVLLSLFAVVMFMYNLFLNCIDKHPEQLRDKKLRNFINFDFKEK